MQEMCGSHCARPNGSTEKYLIIIILLTFLRFLFISYSMQIRLRPNNTLLLLNILINYFISFMRFIKLVVLSRKDALENVNLIPNLIFFHGFLSK